MKGMEYRSRSSPADDVMGLKPPLASTLFPPSFPSSRSTSLDIDHPYWESEFGICFFHLSGLSSLTDDLSRQSSKSVLLLHLSLFFPLLHSSFSIPPLFPLFRNISTFYPSLRIHAGTSLTRALLETLLYNLFSRYGCHWISFSLSLSVSLPLFVSLSLLLQKTEHNEARKRMYRRLGTKRNRCFNRSSSEFELHKTRPRRVSLYRERLVIGGLPSSWPKNRRLSRFSRA